VRRILSRPDALHCNKASLRKPGLSWPAADSIQRLAITACCRWRRKGASLAAASLSVTTPTVDRERVPAAAYLYPAGCVVTEQIQSRVSNNVDYDLLCHERDNFRILVAITNAVLSRLDIDELVSEVAKEIHHYFVSMPSASCYAAIRKGKLSIYSTHYLDAIIRRTIRAKWMKPVR
jgi:formate hydrogenlyase transcriptional activator